MRKANAWLRGRNAVRWIKEGPVLARRHGKIKNRQGSKAHPRGTEQARYTKLGRMRLRRHGKIKTGMGARPIPGAQNRLGTQG